MPRTVKVILEAAVGRYRRGFGEAKKSTDLLADAIDGVNGKTLDGAAGSAKGLGDAVDDAAQRAARDFAEMQEQARKLDGQILNAERDMRSLAKAFANTGDPKILAAWKEQGRVLGDLKGVRKSLTAAAPAMATEFVGKFAGTFGPLLQRSSIQPHLAAVLGGAGLAAAPFLGATISGAILGGVGIGGIVGAFAVAQRDPRVSSAIEGLGERLNARLERAAGQFVGPALKAIQEIERAIGSIDLDSIFGSAGQLLPMLTKGIATAIRALGDGIEALMRNAGPAVHAIADGIASIGQAIGRGMASLSDNGDAAASALQALFGVITLGIDAVFMLINGLTEVFDIARKIGSQGIVEMLAAWAPSADSAATATQRLASATTTQSDAAKRLAKAQEEVATQNKAVTAAQNALDASLAAVTSRQSAATTTASYLQRAMDSLYGASIRQMDANEGYQASWDNLSEAIKANGRSLNIHTTAGRANRDALQQLLTTSGELYLADVNAGIAVDEATRKHRRRTEAVREEARRVGLNKTETEKLIKTYGNIPPKKITELVLDGLKGVITELKRLYLAQRALAEGKTVDQVIGGYQGDPRVFKAAGGPVPGRSPSATADNIPAMLTADEWVIRQPSARKMQKETPGALDYINRFGRLPGYAGGGQVHPVDTSRRWPFSVDVNGTYIMSKADALAKVVPAGPSGTTGPWMQRLLESRFGVGMISGFRRGSRTLSGNLSYHALNRAVDFPPVAAMARFMYENFRSQLKEAITPYQQWNVHNGRDRVWSGAVWNQHNFAGGNAHNHFAMAGGGVIGEPVFGVGRSGSTYSFAEKGPERVLSAAQTAAGGGVTIINNWTVNVPPTVNLAEVGRDVVSAITAFERGSGARWRGAAS